MSNPPKGTRDLPPEELRLRNWLFQNFREVSQPIGFEEVDFRVLESEAQFIRIAGNHKVLHILHCIGLHGIYRCGVLQ